MRKEKNTLSLRAHVFPPIEEPRKFPTYVLTSIYLFILKRGKERSPQQRGKTCWCFHVRVHNRYFFFLHTIPVCDRFVPVHFGFEEKPAETRDIQKIVHIVNATKKMWRRELADKIVSRESFSIFWYIEKFETTSEKDVFRIKAERR